jgi:ATP-dependent exoDNAse (exonuclease V) beta subunit
MGCGMSDAAETPPEPAPEAPKKFDRRKISGPENGKRAGCPPGVQHAGKRKYDEAELVATAVESILTGKAVAKVLPTLGAPTHADAQMLKRVAGLSIDEFNARLSQKLSAISDKVADEIYQRLEANQFKSGELGFVLAISEDKRSRLDGRTALAGTTVNVQVNNNYDGPRPERDEVLQRIGLKQVAIEV